MCFKSYGCISRYYPPYSSNNEKDDRTCDSNLRAVVFHEEARMQRYLMAPGATEQRPRRSGGVAIVRASERVRESSERANALLLPLRASVTPFSASAGGEVCGSCTFRLFVRPSGWSRRRSTSLHSDNRLVSSDLVEPLSSSSCLLVLPARDMRGHAANRAMNTMVSGKRACV